MSGRRPRAHALTGIKPARVWRPLDPEQGPGRPARRTM